jgi:hypothetical protein
MLTERVIEYVLPKVNEGAEQEILRLTISEMSTVQHARWRRYQREVEQWATDSLGLDASDPELEDMLSEDAKDRRERGYRRAAMLGSLKKVEIGTCGAEGEDPQAWRETQLPKEWSNLEGFIDDMPWRLFDLWLAVAAECNPGTFFREVEPEEKKRKAGQVFVRRLTKSLTIS